MSIVPAREIDLCRGLQCAAILHDAESYSFVNMRFGEALSTGMHALYRLQGETLTASGGPCPSTRDGACACVVTGEQE